MVSGGHGRRWVHWGEEVSMARMCEEIKAELCQDLTVSYRQLGEMQRGEGTVVFGVSKSKDNFACPTFKLQAGVSA